MTTTADAAVADAVAAYDPLGHPPRPDLTALVCGSLVAGVGVEPAACRREGYLFAAVQHEDRNVVVRDARDEDRLRQQPGVTGERGRLRFYASHQLTTPQGAVIGALCVTDDRACRLSRTR